MRRELGQKEVMEMAYAVEIKGIRQKFGEKEVLKGINLKVLKGEIFGLLGPSGAGKTTLVKILTGQLGPSAGSLQFFQGEGRDCRRYGMMMDNFGLYERLSCYDNLKLFARIYGVPNKKIDEILKKVGLEEDRKCPVSKLSKGMRGRLSLARALMHEPKLLFLDEPTSGLDPVTGAWIHNLILGERQRGATIFLTTHNMEEAHKLCGHVALLCQGSIVEYGNPEEICRKYNHQNKLHIRLRDGQCVELPNGKEAAEAVRDYLAEGLVETIHSTEPSLETVFMELTGRRLEEG